MKGDRQEAPAAPELTAQPVPALVVTMTRGRDGCRRLWFEPAAMTPGDGMLEAVELGEDDELIAVLPTPGLVAFCSDGVVEDGEPLGAGTCWYAWQTGGPIPQEAAGAALEQIASARRIREALAARRAVVSS